MKQHLQKSLRETCLSTKPRTTGRNRKIKRATRGREGLGAKQGSRGFSNVHDIEPIEANDFLRS